MLRRRLWVFLALAAVVLAACGDDDGGGGTTGGGGESDLVVGISWNNYAQPRWAKADGPAIIEAVEAAGGTVIETNANDSSEQQLADVDSLINQGADVLILLAKDAEAILPAVQNATEARYPGDRVRPAHRGRERVLHHVQQRAGRHDHGGGDHGGGPRRQLRDIKGHSADPNADFLRGGMTPVLDEFPGINIVCEDYNDDWATENALAMMEACLAANNNEIDAVISENDSMATGVVAALDAVGLAGTVPVTGQDGDDPALNRVALGTQLVSVWKDAFALGQTAGEVAVQLAEGVALEEVVAPDDLQDHVAPEAGTAAQPFTTPGGLEVQSIVLKPTPITMENLNLVIDSGGSRRRSCAPAFRAGTVEVCG